jgi:glycosyltransferase involved in cell wall biosynthesis
VDRVDVAGVVGGVGMSRVLYLTRNGLLEPLGQSQIWPYLRGLSSDHRITLISFEKPADRADSSAMERMRRQCAKHGILWIPLQFRSQPRPWASALAIPQLALVALWQWSHRRHPQLVHARSYVPAAIALLLHRITGVPFIFDMRALWPEELITAGHLRRDSPLHRALVLLERCCLQEASAVVSLTQAAVGYLQARYPSELAGQRIAVIPTCADLQRFQPAEPVRGASLVIGCIGTVLSGWFLIVWLRAFFDAVARVNPCARFELISRDAPEAILSALQPSSTWANRLSIHAASPTEMPAIVQRHTASVMFYAGGATSELGRSPTRMAEVLGCGRPVVANAGVGDVEQVVCQNRVGVMARGSSSAQMDTCVAELLALLQDPDLTRRCRRTAEQVFSLEFGIAAYRHLYTSTSALNRVMH